MDESVSGWQQLTRLLENLDGDLDERAWGSAALRVLAALVGVPAACLTTRDGELVACTHEEAPSAATLDTVALLRTSGPLLDARSSGRTIAVPDLARGSWPDYARAAASVGVRAVAVVPLDAGNLDAPVLSLFSASARDWSDDDLGVAHFVGSLVATFGAMTYRLRLEQATSEQLQNALDSRVVIEQAKGVLAAVAGIDVEAAFELIRGDARRRSVRLRDVARTVVQDGYRPASAGAPHLSASRPPASGGG